MSVTLDQNHVPLPPHLDSRQHPPLPGGAQQNTKNIAGRVFRKIGNLGPAKRVQNHHLGTPTRTPSTHSPQTAYAAKLLQQCLHNPNPMVLGQGSYKTAYEVNTPGGSGMALTHQPHATVCRDAQVLRLRRFLESQREQGIHRAYHMPKEFQVGDSVVTLAPIMDGRGTSYKKVRDGFTVMAECPVNPKTPYDNPSLNAIRLILNTFTGLLHFYEDAYAIEAHRLVFGDFKLEQLLAAAREGGYVHLVLGDAPEEVETGVRTPGFFHPRKYEVGEYRAASDDLFALKTVLGQLVYRFLTEPLAKGLPEFALGRMNTDWLHEVCIGQIDPIFDQAEIDKAKTQGTYVYNSGAGSYIYAGFLSNTQIRLAQLERVLIAKRGSTKYGSSPTLPVVECLARCLRIVEQGYLQVVAVEEDSTRSKGVIQKTAQRIVRDTLRQLDTDIRDNYLTHAGPTGSPLKDFADIAD